MNIFILSTNPVAAARMQCDQHVVKMPLETAQMLCTAFPNGYAPYKHTHYKHPCNIWLRKAKENYLWLIEHGFALCDEYQYRYQKEHSSRKVIQWCKDHMNEITFEQKNRTPFAVAMDDEFKMKTATASYRNFYVNAKSRFARWEKNRKAPAWYSKSAGN